MANLKIPNKTASDNFNLQDFKDDFTAIGGQLDSTAINILYPPVSMLPATGTKTEVTAAINAIADYCRTNSKDLYIPHGYNFLINGTLDFSGLYVFGSGEGSRITLDSTQVDVIKIDGNSLLENFYIHGGWDGATAGQTGHGINVKNAVNNTPFNVHIKNVKIQYTKQNFIYIERGGYSSLTSVKCNASGLHGLELYAPSGAESITTIDVDNNCTFSDCPNGFGIKITNGICININPCIIENTKGIEIAGNDNRTININGVYQENTALNKFVTLTGSGMNLNIVNCYGTSMSIDYSANFLGTNIIGCTGITLPTGAYEWNMLQTSGNEATFSKLKVLQGLNIKNETGNKPAHSLDSANLSGVNDVLFNLKNNGTVQHEFYASGGMKTGSAFEPWQYGHMTFCGYHMWIDAQGRLRIKATAPTSDGDGTVVGSQA